MEEIKLTLIERYNPSLKEVEIDKLKIYHDNYIGDPLEGVEMLAGSFAEFGQIEPIIVKELPDQTFGIIKGVRKTNAVKSLNWKTISALVITIDDDEVFPLMQALRSHQRKFNYKNLAKRFAGLKEHAKKLLKENRVCGSQDSDETVRQYLGRVLGMNERYVSDFERILESPHKDYILENLDWDIIKFHKAIKMATAGREVPKPDNKNYKGQSEIYMCPECPRRDEFLDKLDNSKQMISKIEDLPNCDVNE